MSVAQLDAKAGYRCTAPVAPELVGLLAVAAGEPGSSRPRAVSPVLLDWFTAWATVLPDDEREHLVRYVPELVGSRGSTEEEVARQWMILDWAMTDVLPRYLSAVGLHEPAGTLRACRGVHSRGALAAVGPAVNAAAEAVRALEDGRWRRVAELAQPPQHRPANVPPWRPVPGAGGRHAVVWGALAEATRSAATTIGTLLRPAAAALAYHRERTAVPSEWTSAERAIENAASAVAWEASFGLITDARWTWRLSRTEAWRAGYHSSSSALDPLRRDVTHSAQDVVARLLALTPARQRR